MDELAEDAGAAFEIFKLKAPDAGSDVPNPGAGDFSFSDPESFGLPSTLSSIGVDWGGLDLSEFETYEPLGILVELAKNGKINPWDIDIVELTDSFLKKVEDLKKMDLRISSRTLLYSAILLRMKSIGILDEEEEPEEESDFFDYEDFPGPEDFPIPKLPVRRLSTRPVTLNELILELKKAEKALSRKNDKKVKQALNEAAAPKGPELSTGDVLGIAHDEAIGARLDLLWARLAEMFKAGHSYVSFSFLLEGSEDRVMDYVSLLFLASGRKVWLCQKELFGELSIYPGDESGFSTEKNPPSFHENNPGEKGELSGPEAPPAAGPKISGVKHKGEGPRESSLNNDGPESGYVEAFSVEANPSEANSAEKNPVKASSVEANPLEE